ncbi:FeoA domain-containing protein [Peptostreptococcaceae bacterium OttesenSCG-928-C18]|nr:FeoA domain-containing protein [Peptostreptococcaceae bacterium OttesenSCG-928-C18]
MITLNNSEVGKSYIIRKINGVGAVRRRIMDMGVTKGTEIFIRKVAPLGDPVQITIRGYELTLRKQDSEIIEIEEI